MRKVMVAGLAVLLCVGMAQAAVTLSVAKYASTSPSLDRYVVTATAAGGDLVVGIANLQITGSVHNVQIPSMGPAIPVLQADDLDGCPTIKADWLGGDTCLLLVDDGAGDLGGDFAETSDASNMYAADFAKYAGSFAPVTGMGTFGHPSATGNMEGLDGTQQAASVDFLQVCLPKTSTGVSLAVDIVYGPAGGSAETQSMEASITEPATMSLLVLGGVAALVRKRR